VYAIGKFSRCEAPGRQGYPLRLSVSDAPVCARCGCVCTGYDAIADTPRGLCFGDDTVAHAPMSASHLAEFVRLEL